MAKAKAKKSKNKTKIKIKKSKVRKPSKSLSKVLHVDRLDKVLLKMAARPYQKILKQIETGKKKLDEDRRMALELGSRILERAKRVRDNLMNVPKSPRR